MYYRTHSNGIDPSLYQKHIASTFRSALDDVYRIQLVTKTQHDTEAPITVAVQLLGDIMNIDNSNGDGDGSSGDTTLLTDVNEDNGNNGDAMEIAK